MAVNIRRSPRSQCVGEAGPWIVGIAVLFLLLARYQVPFLLSAIVAWGCATAANRLVLRDLASRLAQLDSERQLCPHGMPGGETRDLCAECQVERAVKLREGERTRAIAEQRAQHKAAARDLEMREIARLRAERAKTLQGVLSLSSQAFEDSVADIYRRLGYAVEQTPYSNDRGRDAIATKNGQTYLIECKRYDPNRGIGRRDLQILYAAMTEARATGGFLVTTAKAKKTAAEFIRGKGIELVDASRLVELARSAHGPPGFADSFRMMCEECGQVLEHALTSAPVGTQCRCGSQVRSSITESLIREHVTKRASRLPS